jgi:hypothetical protein
MKINRYIEMSIRSLNVLVAVVAVVAQTIGVPAQTRRVVAQNSKPAAAQMFWFLDWSRPLHKNAVIV